MSAVLLFRDKLVIDGTITEVVVWQVSPPVEGCSHSFKYRLFFGLMDGKCMVRYDNERGKGDHRHFNGKEEIYTFETLSQLFRDFNADKDEWRRRK
jgi:hypothetical protein